MSNPFDTLTVFAPDSASQIAFFDGIKNILNSLEGMSPIIIEQATVPTQVQMETAYLAAGVGRTLPVPTTQEFIWTIQGVVQGEYRTIDDFITNLNDTTEVVFNSHPGFAQLMANGDIITSGQTKFDGTASSGLVSINRRTGAITNVGLTNAISYQFSANPAGTKLAFTKLDGGGKKQIYTVNYPALTGLTQLTTSANGCDNPHWVGTKISYLDNTTGSTIVLKIMNDTGTSQTTVLSLGTVTMNQTFQQLSPDLTKIVYTVTAASFPLYSGPTTDIFTVNVVGTGNVKFINSQNATDNPNNEMRPPEAPSWHPSGLWIYYGRRRKNINTSISEQWYTYRLTPPDTFHTALDNSLTIGYEASDWYNKNIGTSTSYGGLLEDQLVYVPSYSNFVLNSQVILTTLTAAASNIAQSLPIVMVSSQADGYTSTGKIYKTSEYIPERGDFELIRTDISVGGETTYSLSKSELADFTHLQIVFTGQSTVGGGVTISIALNEDSTSGNYQNTNVLATTAIVRAYQSLGDAAMIVRGAGGVGVNMAMATVLIPDIQATDAYKQALSTVVYTNSTAAIAVTNYLSGEFLSIWKSTAAIESIRIVVSSALAANSIFSYYGIRGNARVDRDI